MKFYKKYRWRFNVLFLIVLILLFGNEMNKLVDDLKTISVQFMHNIQSPLFYYFLLVILLAIFNLLAEIWKWKVLANTMYYVSWTDALKMVLFGITTSLFTINRSGDFIGKLFFIKSEFKASALVLSFIGNFMQLLCTLIFGSLGVWIWKDTFHLNSNSIWVIISLCVLCIIFLLSVFHRRRIFTFFKRWNWIEKYWQNLERLRSLNKLTIIKIGLISVLRYMIFTLQFVCLFYFFNVNDNIFLLTSLVTFFYLAMIFSPSIFLVELGVRGVIAVYIFSTLKIAKSIIIATCLGIYFLNIFLPAFFGIIFYIYFIIVQTLNHEKV